MFIVSPFGDFGVFLFLFLPALHRGGKRRAPDLQDLLLRGVRGHSAVAYITVRALYFCTHALRCLGRSFASSDGNRPQHHHLDRKMAGTADAGKERSERF